MLIQKISNMTGKVSSMDLPVTEEQLSRWRKGGLIQEVMPHLSKEEREFIMTGVTPEEWKEMMGDEE